MKNYVVVILLGIVVLAMMIISTPYLLIRGALETLFTTLKTIVNIYVDGVEELLT